MFRKIIPSPLGPVLISATEKGLAEVLFLEDGQEAAYTHSLQENALCREAALQLEAYFLGKRKTFDLLLAPEGTPFRQLVWQELLKIPYGTSVTYTEIARNLNNPLSVRAVGTANGQNPLAVIIPCHRVIGADGTLTGYAGGLWRKEFLLRLEGHPLFAQPTLF